MGSFHITGIAAYRIDFAKQAKEFGSITPFSQHRGSWALQGEVLHCISESDCSAYSGNYYAKQIELEATVKLLDGDSHMLIFRAQGIMRHYLAGFDQTGTVSFYRQNFGCEHLASANYNWQHNQEYRLKIVAVDDQFTLYINGESVLTCRDQTFAHGMFGFDTLRPGACEISDLHVKTSESVS